MRRTYPRRSAPRHGSPRSTRSSRCAGRSSRPTAGSASSRRA